MEFTDSSAHVIALGAHHILLVILQPLTPVLGIPGAHWDAWASLGKISVISRHPPRANSKLCAPTAELC